MYLLRNSMERLKLIHDQFFVDQSRQKSYVDRDVRDLTFMVVERVLLKVLLTKGVMQFSLEGWGGSYESLLPLNLSVVHLILCLNVEEISS